MRRSAGASVFENVEAVFYDVVDLNGGVLIVDGVPAVIANSADAAIRLEGGALRSDGTLRLPQRASMIGPGTVRADTLRVSGVLRLASRGELRVVGSVVLGSGAVTRLEFARSGADRIVATGAALVDGALRLVSAPASGRPRDLVEADDRVGSFGVVTGVPSPRRVEYTPTKVRLV